MQLKRQLKIFIHSMIHFSSFNLKKHEHFNGGRSGNAMTDRKLILPECLCARLHSGDDQILGVSHSEMFYTIKVAKFKQLHGNGSENEIQSTNALARY
jgi:hypothetical protein